jgi:hypothetical protein
MFYCEACQRRKNWPEGFSFSYGRCEVCGNTAACYDVPSSALPLPPAYQPKHKKTDN